MAQDTLIKVCGLTAPEAVDAAVDAGATHIGLVHFDRSPRHLPLDKASELRRRVPSSVRVVLVMVNAGPEALGPAYDAIRPDVLQCHGSETPEWMALVREKVGVEVWRAVGVRDRETLEKSLRFKGSVDRLLYDAPAKALPGGTGTAFDWSLLADHDHQLPWGLAGGLCPDSVAEAIRKTGAPLVDASSGLEETPGVKSIAKITAFCRAAREA